MSNSGFNKLFWGFLFIMFNFRIQGFDILPDIVGYLFLASGFGDLLSNSSYFSTAAKFNVPMIVLSLFSIYQSPAQGEGIHLGVLGILGIPVVIASFILNLLVIYNLFMGTKDMAEQQEQHDLAQEAEKRWNQYKLLQFAFLFSFILIFIPPVAFLYIIVFFIISIILTIGILGFLRRCSENLNTLT
jgi:hypothetical protein